ncbi:MAG: PadR family transcriptional regulator [Phycisphaerae bacterium]|nr:PadR family transcriptional regulator [Phycisphaerae bacterium]
MRRKRLSFKYAILGLLADGPRHGYELRALYEAHLVPSAKLNFGQVYPALDRLQRDGWVEHDVVSQQERPDKKVYSLTEEGQSQLRAWLGTPSALNLEARNETFLKLMLARRLAQVEPLEVLKIEKRACFARLHEVTQARARAKEEGESVQAILLLDLAFLRLEAFMKWFENCDEVLRQEGQS